MEIRRAPLAGITDRLGFTITELLIAVVIITLLVGIAVPAIGTIVDDAKVATILDTCDRVKKACRRYHADTSLHARECVELDDGPVHELTADGSMVRGWDGPYMRPFAADDHPTGGEIVVYSTMDGGRFRPDRGRFKLNGPGSTSRKGNGNFIVFTDIPQPIAEAVDAALDEGVSGNWRRFGRVQWSGRSRGHLMIYLLSD